MNIKMINKQQKGGVVLTGILFFTCMIFYLIAFGLTPENSQTAQYLSGTNNLGIINVVLNSQGGVGTILTVLGVVVSAVSLLFPNPYTLFGGIFTILVGIVLGISSDVFGIVYGIIGVGIGFKLIVSLMTITLILSLIDWYRQGTQL